ncbi:tail fiber domain-containing protein [Rahnella variigena]|jgi:hypothetical protein|uniref:Peptidase S74 domain-containing protein n=1 Tax=Rahnella variigena TaxID=574964 RepID=A0ABX9PPP8_9GAMM|nr:tail fiber domain-containing protein [Rahnella variigena]RJT50296.1 tail fiber domain-containing protein [Rahnella variigena]RKF66339.1 hypothetical protein CKQ54_23385 [Rahnella variigena]
MSAGTIALTNNSANVTGTGTAFTADLKAGDFVVAIVGGVTYTLGVKTITSSTALTLVTAYGGPTATGNAWTAVPNATLVGITAQVAADTARAIRGLNLDKANWQQVYSGTGNITVTLPDGSTFTGPSWNYLVTNMATKVGGAVPVNQGGTGATTAAAARSSLGAAPTSAPVITDGATLNGTIAIEGTQLNLRASASGGGWPFFITFMAGQGNNLPYSRIYAENSGDITMATGVNATVKYFQHTASGDLIVPRNIQCTTLIQTSDRDKKDFITPIANALDKINAIDGVTFAWKTDGTPSAGVIAQDLMKVLPEAVGSIFDENDEYGTEEQQVEREVVDDEGNTTTVTETVSVTKLTSKRDESKRSYTVEYNGVIALAVQAIKELSEKVAAMEAYIGPENLTAMSKEPTS